MQHADSGSAPALIFGGLALMVAGAAMAKWWRQVAAFLRRGQDVMGYWRESSAFGSDDDISPRGIGVAIIFAVAAVGVLLGLVYVITGLGQV